MQTNDNTNLFKNIQQNLLLNYPFPVYTMNYYYSETPFFSELECEQIKKFGYSNHLEFLKTAENIINLSIFNSKTCVLLPSNDVNFIYEKIRQHIFEKNKKIWFFNLYDFGEPLKFMEYNEIYKGFAETHRDLAENGVCKYRKLTIIVQLSDEKSYEGGELLVQCENTFHIMPKKQGTIIIFPSFLLHKVNPIKKGIRNSLVTFAYGPPFC